MLHYVLKKNSELSLQEPLQNTLYNMSLQKSILCSFLLTPHLHLGQGPSSFHVPSVMLRFHWEPRCSVKAKNTLPSLSERFFSSFSQAEVCAPSVACRFSICRRSGRVADVTLWLSSWFRLSASWSLWNHKLNIIKLLIVRWIKRLILNPAKHKAALHTGIPVFRLRVK